LSNENAGKQQELDKNILEQVASHTTMIEKLSKSISSISADIHSLQHQSAGLDINIFLNWLIIKQLF
jgi:hypothetical protein